jgi:hypothetical protein
LASTLETIFLNNSIFNVILKWTKIGQKTQKIALTLATIFKNNSIFYFILKWTKIGQKIHCAPAPAGLYSIPSMALKKRTELMKTLQ